MPKPGKPSANPFTAAVTSGKQSSMPASATDRPDRPSTKPRRGLRIVDAESRLPQLPMRKAALLSTGLHVLGPFVMTALILLALFIISLVMHFNFWDLFKAKAPPQDMEFTLVNDTHATRPDHPVFKGNFNQRAGGKHRKNEPLKATEEQAQSNTHQNPSTSTGEPVHTATSGKTTQARGSSACKTSLYAHHSHSRQNRNAQAQHEQPGNQ
jgi:hypothetical protein